MSLGAGATLNVRAGDYRIDNLSLSPGAILRVDSSAGPVRVFVRQGLTWEGKVTNAAGDPSKVLLGYVGTTPVSLAGSFSGTLLAPNASLTLQTASSGSFGGFFAKSVTLKPDVTLTVKPYESLCSGVVVDDNNPCTTDACNAATGAVTHTPVSNGTSCNDGNGCTQTDTCQSGTCTGSNPVVCSAQDQCHVAGICSPGTGLCSNPAKADGSSCNDGSLCTQADTCRSGVCTGSNPITCTALDQCHVAGTCNPATGTCSNPNKADGSACSDGDACTQTDKCSAGSCAGSNPVVCAAQDQCHTAGSCDHSTGTCSNPSKPNGAACTDGNACTQSDTCQSGTCVGSSPVLCVAQGQCQNAGTCDPGTGACSNPNKANGTACDDGNKCTTSDACADGACVGGSLVTCAAKDQCHDAGTCDASTGICSDPAKANGAACDDGNACTRSDTCQGGTCSGADPTLCVAQDSCHQAGTCDTATGACSNPAKPEGSACSDGNACTSGDACHAGACSATPVAVDDNNPCTADACDPFAGVTHVAVAAGTACADADRCNGDEVCIGTGQCIAGTKPAIDDANPCTADSCDPSSGVSHTPVASGSSCSDGNACNGEEKCSAAGQCVAGTPIAVDDSNPCTADACDPVAGVSHTPVAAGLSCDDGNVCNGDERCDAMGACTGGTPLTVDDNDACTWDVCDPMQGVEHSEIPGCRTPKTGQPFETRASIMGQVVHADGSAVSSFTVTVFDYGADTLPRTDVETSIDADGRFRTRLRAFPESAADRTPPQRVVIRIDGADFPSVYRAGYVRPGDVLPLGAITVLQRDGNVTVIGPAGGTATDSQGTLELVVPPGALSEATPVRLTPIHTRAEFPAPLPNNTLTTYGMELEPSGTTFAVPATLRIQNTLNLPTTLKIPGGTWDPQFADWEPTGQAVWDGTRFVAQIRHFSTHDWNPSAVGELITIVDIPQDPAKSRDKGCVGSSVGYSNGSLQQSFGLPMHAASGRDYSLTLNYDSGSSGSVSLGVSASSTLGSSGNGSLVRSSTGVSMHTKCVPPGGAEASACGGGGPPCGIAGVIVAPYTANQTFRLFSQEFKTEYDLPANTDQYESTFNYVLPNDTTGVPARNGYFANLVAGQIGTAGSKVCVAGGAGFGVAAPEPTANGGVAPGSVARVALQEGVQLDFPNYELVLHRRTSPLGSGWGLADVGTLYRTPDHMAADLVHGNGEKESFRPYPSVRRLAFLNNTGSGALALDRQTSEVFVSWSQAASIAKLNLADGSLTGVAPNPIDGFVPITLSVTYVNGQRRFLVATKRALFEVEGDGTTHQLAAFAATTLPLAAGVAGVGKYAYFTSDKNGSGGDLQTVSRVDLTDPQRTVVTITSGAGGNLSLDPHGLVKAKDFWFMHPRGLAPAYDGGLYVSDDRRHVVYHLAPDSNGEVGPESAVTRVLGSGQGTMMVGLGRKLPALEMSLHAPEAMTTAADGTLYVTSNRETTNVGSVLAFDPIEQTAHYVAFDRDSLLRNVEISVRGGSLAPLGQDRLIVPHYDSIFALEAPFTSEFDPTRELSFSQAGATIVDATADKIEEYRWTTAANNEAQLVAEKTRSGEPIRAIAYKDEDRIDYIQDPVGGRVVFGYDAAGHIASITDAANRSTQFTVDSTGNLKEVVYPTGEALRFDYEDFRLTSVTHPNSETSHYTYAPDGTLQSAQRPGGGTTQIRSAMSIGPQYDSTGKLYYEAKLTDDRGVQHAIQVNAAGAVIQDQFTADGQAYTVQNVYASQLVGPSSFETIANRLLRFSTTVVNGVQVGPTATFNPAGQLINLQSSGSIVSSQYDSLKRLSKIDWGVTGVDWNYTYDLDGHLTKVADVFNYGGETGRRSVMSNFRAADGQPGTLTEHGVTTTLGYDALGLVNAASDSVGRTLGVTHDPAGNPVVVSDGTSTVSYSYDSGGRVTSITDAEGNATQLSYQNAGCGCSNGDRVTSIITPDLRGNEHWSFDYDADGNLQGVTTPLSEQARYSFNPQGDVTAVVDQKLRSTIFSYDQLGRRSSVTDAQGRVGTYAYSVPAASAWAGPTLYAQSSGSSPAPTTLSAALGDGQFQVGVNGLRTSGVKSHVSFYRDATFQLAYWNEHDVLGRLSWRADRTGLPIDSTAAGPNSDAGPVESQLNGYGNYGSPFSLLVDRFVPDANSTRTWSGQLGRNPDFDITNVGRFLGLASGDLAYVDNVTIGRDTAGRVTSTSTSAVVQTAGREIAASALTYKPNGQLDSIHFKSPAYVREFDGSPCYCGGSCPALRECSQNTDDCSNKGGTASPGQCAAIHVGTVDLSQEFEYDARGLVSVASIETGENGVSPIGTFQYGYDEVGRNTLLVYPDGHTREQQFDALGRLTSRCYSYADGTPQHCYTAQYDAVGNPTVLSDPDMRQEITYDALDRVTEVRRYVPPAATQPAHIESYAYNSLGGFAIYDGVAVDDHRPRLGGGGTASAGIPATVGGQPVVLDAGGRVASLNGSTFKYYKLNHRLQSITTATQTDSFSYDSLERLAEVESTPAGGLPYQQLFLYSGVGDSIGAVAAVVKKAPTSPPSPVPDPPNPFTRARFIYDGIDHPLAMPGTRDGTIYFEVDAIGNVRHLHGAAGSTDARDLGGYTYTAFGKTIPASDPGYVPPPQRDQPLRWQGRPQLAPNLYDFRARIWSTDLGAFLQPDEYGYLTRGGTLWSWPGQNPVRWRDPSGRFAGPLPPVPVPVVTQLYLAGVVGYTLGYNVIGPIVFAAEDAKLNAAARATAALENQGRPEPGTPCKTEAGGGGDKGRLPPGGVAEAGEEDEPGRGKGREAQNASNAARLLNQLIAEEIAGGHAFDKHVVVQREFPRITTRAEFAAEIEEFLNSPETLMRNLANGRTAYWNDGRGTVLIRNPGAPDGGTFFRPMTGGNYFWKLK